MKYRQFLLLTFMVFCLTLQTGCDGKQGERGLTGPKGAQGDSDIEYWLYTVEADDVIWSDTLNTWMVWIFDSRINSESTYDIWVDLGKDLGYMNLNLYYDGVTFQYVMVVNDGYLILSTDEDFTGKTLRIFKMEGLK